MRDVLGLLESRGLRWYITGSEAAASYGVLRQTFDLDVVLDLEPGRFGALARELEADHALADEIDYGDFSMASIISRRNAEKVDLILRRGGPWPDAAMARRRRLEHPSLGAVWASSLEDLILAKLVWSEGTSELQLRDCAALIRSNQAAVDDGYLERWARVLGVGPLLGQVRDAP